MLQTCVLFVTCLSLLKRLGDAAKSPEPKYIEEVGWLRLHIAPVTWHNARLQCNAAGEILASPTTKAIKTVMKTMMSTNKLAIRSVFIDIHASFPIGVYISIDGTPQSNITFEWAAGEPNNQANDEDCLVMNERGELSDVKCNNVYPFFCLNKLAHKECFTKDYEYDSRTGRCYKFHRVATDWHHAAMICTGEHAHLAIINSDIEASVLEDLFARNPTSTIQGTHPDHAYIGYMDKTNNQNWVTIEGQTLADAGYAKWAPSEPDLDHDDMSFGGISRRILLTSDRSVESLPFICESFAIN